jgi:hypothetical protein
MYRSLLLSLTLLGLQAITHVYGQSLGYGVIATSNASKPFTISGLTLDVKTAQDSAGIIKTFNNSLSGDLNVYNYAYPATAESIAIGGLYCWAVPSVSNPLNFTIAPGNYAVLTDLTSTDTLRAAVYFTAPDGRSVAYYGPSVIIQRGTSANLPIPACSMTYTAPPPFAAISVSDPPPATITPICKIVVTH